MDLLNQFEAKREVEYRGERYEVRDNGAVCRMARTGKRLRPLDNIWTFGKQGPSDGYMHVAGVQVHRIVCAAFSGPPPTDQHVVDHIDTNKANNRPENLRWVTRLENVLLNPITVARIEFAYGSLDAFFDDPQSVKSNTKFSDVSWMRTVTKEEAATAKARLLTWAKSEKMPRGGILGEWIYGTNHAPPPPEAEKVAALTPSAIQLNWKVPSMFPECPSKTTDDALEQYSMNLEFGKVFAENKIYSSRVVDHALTEDGLVVLTRTSSGVKDWALAQVYVDDSHFYHKSKGTFFELQGALKAFCKLSDVPFGDPIDDYC